MAGKHIRPDTMSINPSDHRQHAPAHFDNNIFDLGWWPSLRNPDPARMRRRMEKQSFVTDISPSSQYQVDFWRSWATYFADAADRSFEKWRAEKRLNDGKVQKLEDKLDDIKSSMESYERAITNLQEKDRKSQEYIKSLQIQLRAALERQASADHQDSATHATPQTEPHRESGSVTPPSQPRCPTGKAQSTASSSSSPSSTNFSAGSSSSSSALSSSGSSSIISTPSSSRSSPINFPARNRVTKKAATTFQKSETAFQKSEPELDPFKPDRSTLSTQSKLVKIEDLLEKIQANDAVLHKLSKEAMSTHDIQLKYQATEINFTITALQNDLSKQRESYVNLRDIVRKMEKSILNQTMTIKEMKQTIKGHQMRESQQQQQTSFLEQRVVGIPDGAQTAHELSITCSDGTTSVAIEPKDGEIVVLPRAAVDGFLAALGVEKRGMLA